MHTHSWQIVLPTETIKLDHKTPKTFMVWILSLGSGPVCYPSWRTENFKTLQQLLSFFPACQANPDPECIF